MFGSTPFASAPFASGGKGEYKVSLSDSFAVSSDSVSNLLPYLYDTLNIGVSSSTTAQLFNAITASIGVQDSTLLAWSVFASSAIDFTTVAENTYTIVLAAVDLLLATGVVTSQNAAFEAVADAIAAQTLIVGSYRLDASDAVAFSDALAEALHMAFAVVDTIAAQDAAVPTVSVLLLAGDGFNVATASAMSMTMVEAVQAGLDLFIDLRLDTGEFSGWVLNAESRGVTEYRNYEFNSFAGAYGTCYGTNDDGLYELTGADDAGTAIDAWIRSALVNLGSDVLKNVPEVYLGLTTDGSMVLKAIVSNDPTTGGKREFWYRMVPKTAASSQGTRFEPGKGLEAVYWQWELHNVDGADFSLNVVSLYPVMYTRRV